MYFSIEAIAICTPNDAQVFPFLHILALQKIFYICSILFPFWNISHILLPRAHLTLIPLSLTYDKVYD